MIDKASTFNLIFQRFGPKYSIEGKTWNLTDFGHFLRRLDKLPLSIKLRVSTNYLDKLSRQITLSIKIRPIPNFCTSRQTKINYLASSLQSAKDPFPHVFSWTWIN
jgi:hypothetical protein